MLAACSAVLQCHAPLGIFRGRTKLPRRTEETEVNSDTSGNSIPRIGKPRNFIRSGTTVVTEAGEVPTEDWLCLGTLSLKDDTGARRFLPGRSGMREKREKGPAHEGMREDYVPIFLGSMRQLNRFRCNFCSTFSLIGVKPAWDRIRYRGGGTSIRYFLDLISLSGV